jgi:glycosyltransferase involved in cell wall biosynthesis
MPARLRHLSDPVERSQEIRQILRHFADLVKLQTKKMGQNRNNLNLSVVIVAQDEERTIGAVLDAVKDIASEIILVDSGSTDNTVEIAKAHGAACQYRAWQGYADQKNFAISQAKSSWILSLDADEILTEPLVAEIKDLLSSNQCEQYAGFTIPRILYIGNQPLKHGGFYPDAQLRLFKNGHGQFNDRIVHESIKVTGPVRQLINPMLHYAYPNLTAFAQAMDKYAHLSAQEFTKRYAPKINPEPALIGSKHSDPIRENEESLGAPASSRLQNPRQGDQTESSESPFIDLTPSYSLRWRTSKLNELLHPCWTFLYRYIGRAGFLDGTLGLKANLIYANYVQKKIKYLRESLTEDLWRGARQ